MYFDDDDFNPYDTSYMNGCEIHGGDYIIECAVCGREFCSICYPHSHVCEECAAQGVEESTLESEDEISLIDEIVQTDPEMEKETSKLLADFDAIDQANAINAALADEGEETPDAPTMDEELPSSAVMDALARSAKQEAVAKKQAAQKSAPKKAPAKPAAKKPAAPAKSASKPLAKSTAKPVSKPAAKKPAPKPAAKKSPAKSAAKKPAPKSAPKSASKKARK